MGLLALMGSLVAGLRPADAASGVALARLAGSDRYATAAAVAETAFPGGARTAVVASGLQFPDALTGAFLAGLQSGGAPVLLVSTHSPVPAPTVAALVKLGVEHVLVVGGPAAVGSDVVSALSGLSGPSGHLSVTRVYGSTRYDTMAAVDAPPAAGEPPIGQVEGRPTAILATGNNFADALGAAPLAYARHLPLILTDGTASTLVPQALSVIRADHIGHVIVVGGPAAIAPAQLTQLEGLGVSLDLTATHGLDRSQTSAELAGLEVSSFGFLGSRADVARGDDFADALAAGPLGGTSDTPTLVTLSPSDPGAVTAYLTHTAGAGMQGYVLGGPAALSPVLVQTLDSVLAPTTTTSTTTSSTTTTTALSSPTASPYAPGAVGYDVSWPQCGGSLPPVTGLSVVGVDHGRPLTTNSCLAAEVAWAGASPSAYFTLAYPTPGWSASGCSSADAACIAAAYGQATAAAALAQARSSGLAARVFWAAVVTANSWSSDQALNVDVVQAALGALTAAGFTAGVYSTASQWQAILGSWTTSAPVWVPGSSSAPAASCGSVAFSTTGVWLVQVPGSTWDQDGACPLPSGALPAPTRSGPTSSGTVTGSGPTGSGGSPYASGSTGYDISWPQCPAGVFPTAGAISVVGANDGHPFSVNPCLSSEAAWAGGGLSVYLNLASPSAADSHSLSGPAGACASSDLSCQSYNYGANSVTYSLQALSGDSISPRFVWLDIETGNTWSSSTADNAQVVQGALAALSSAGLGAGIYSTSYQWSQIAGSYVPSVPEWVPSGMGSAPSASGLCGNTYFSSGPTWLVQYGAGNYDGDVAC